MKSILSPVFLLTLLLPLFSGCELLFDTNDDLVLKTMDARNVRDSTAEFQLLHEGSLSKYTIYGIVYSTLSKDPTYPYSTVFATSNQKDTVVVLKNLNRLTTYYYRTFASDGINCEYGNVKTFTTISSMPQIVTSSISGITETSAISGGTINDDGGETLLSRGLCWSTSENPTIDLPTKSSDGRGNDAFRSTIRGLTPNTRYYVRAYATNRMGISYGEQVSFVAHEHPLVAIGDLTEGGFVFYVDNTGRHGLVCAPSDQSTGCYWSTTYPMTTAARSQAIGSGFINTSLIVLLYGKGKYAAKICDELVLNSYNDWYLPTCGELLSIYFNLIMHGKGNFSIPDGLDPFPYWSCSEQSESTAYAINMRKDYGNSLIYTKNLSRACVRAIRSF